MNKLVPASLALAFAAPVGALADAPAASAPEIQTLRTEIQAIRAAYEARLQALELRLAAAEERTAVTASPSNLPPPPPSPPTRLASGANAFNPALSLILSGGYSRTSQDPANYRITGVQLPIGSAAGPGLRGFSLGESELTLSANIDPWLRGAASVALRADNSVSIEEAFIQTTSLGNGLSFKAGRFYSGIGYLNPQHAHVWDFADNPLAYQAFLGTQYGDDGVQLKWLAPTERYISLSAELGRGRGFPGGNAGRNGAGMTALTAHTGGDIGLSQSWRAGVSRLTTKASDQSLSAVDASGDPVTNIFSGNTRVWIVDGVWKWAPEGNSARTNFKLQGEYLRSSRDGGLAYDIGGANTAGAYQATQSGWYVQGVYQFMPRWRAGLRTERLNPGTQDVGANSAAFPGKGYMPSKHSLMLEYNPSEFSRVRLQFAQDRSRQSVVDHQVFLLYQMSLGAHGAHGY